MAKEVTYTIIVYVTDNYYRAISVISTIAKVFERIIYYQLYASLSDHNILSKHQSGFHLLHSTVTALLEACNIDIGNVNAIAFLDQRKRLTQSIMIS